MRPYLILISFWIVGISVQAQNDWSWSQYHYFGDSNYSAAGIWGSAHYEILSNHLTNEVVNQAIFDGKITPEATAFIDEYSSDAYTQFSAGTLGELWFRTGRKGKWRPLFGAGYRDMATATLKVGLVQHYLRGNGPYEDQQVELGPSQLDYHSYQFAGGGFEHSNGKTTWGVTAQLIKSSRFARFTMNNSGIYTAPFGTSIEADVDFRYDYTSTEQPKLGAWYGTGYSINGFFQHQAKSDGPLISFQLKDFGQIFYKGVNRWKLNDSLVFSGVEAENILQLDDSLINGGDLDSLEALLGLEQAHPFARTAMPARIVVNYVHPLGQRSSLSIQLRQYLAFGIPEFRVGYAYRVAPWLALEPTIRVGGFTRFDVGLSAAINAKNKFQLIIKSEQFENLIVPDKSTGQYLFVGGQLKF